MGLRTLLVAVLATGAVALPQPRGHIRGAKSSEAETSEAKTSVPASSAPIADGPNAGRGLVRGARVEETSVLTSGASYDLDAAALQDATAAGRRLQTCNLGETLKDAGSTLVSRALKGVPKTTYKCVKEVPGAPKYCVAMKAVAIKGKPLPFPIPHGPGCAYPSSHSEWLKLNLFPWSDRTKITEETWDGTAYGDVVPDGGASLHPSCGDLKISALDLHGGFASFAKGDGSPLGATGNAMTGVLAGILATNALEKSLDALYVGMNGAVTVLDPLINAIPVKVIKSIFEVFVKQANIAKNGIKAARDKLKEFNENKAVEKVRKYACKGQDLTKTLATGLVLASEAHDLSIEHYLQRNDGTICNEWYLSHATFLAVGVMTAATEDFEGLNLDFASDRSTVEFFDFVTDLSENCALKDALEFFKDLEEVIKPVNDAINFEVDLDIFGSFTVGDILELVGGPVDLIVAGAEALLSEIAGEDITLTGWIQDAVDAIGFPNIDDALPDFDFPSFPDFDFDLPALPELDPADFFPALPDGLTSAPTPVELNINTVDTAGCQKLSEDCPAVCPYTRSCPMPQDLSEALLDNWGDFAWDRVTGSPRLEYDGTFRSRNLNCSADDLSVGDLCIADGVCALPEDGKLCVREMPDVTEVCPDVDLIPGVPNPFAGEPCCPVPGQCPGLCDCPLVTDQVSVFQIVESLSCTECTTNAECDGECDLSQGPGRKLRFGAGAVGCCA